MAVYPGAVNLLIPRGTVGNPSAQTRITPTIIILHTNASNTSLAGAASLMLNTTKGQEYHFQQEAAGTGRVAGRLGQYVDTTIRADNNFKANSFMSGGRLCGAISIETADHGSPYEKSWTDLGQRQNLEDLVVWLCRTHGIPARQCPDPFSPGIGYHSLWGYNTSTNPNVNPWTNAVGKICPGPGKIREYPDLLATVARRVTEGDDMPLDANDIAKIGAETIRILRAPEFQVGFVDNIVQATQTDVKTLSQDVDHLATQVASLEAKIDALTVGGGQIDPAALAEAVADEMASRLQE